MICPNNNLTQKQLKALLKYNPDAGLFIWLVTRGLAKSGHIAGTVTSRGYVAIKINGTLYKAHRLAFLYVTGKFPTNTVDHINGILNDNKWLNLRDVPHIENMRNQKCRSNNTSGTIGVHFDKIKEKWCASIMNNKKRVHLGYFIDIFDAACARKSAEIKYGYHENHGR